MLISKPSEKAARILKQTNNNFQETLRITI